MARKESISDDSNQLTPITRVPPGKSRVYTSRANLVRQEQTPKIDAPTSKVTGKFVFRFILVVVLIALLLIFVKPINNWFGNITNHAFDFFGWGLFLLVITIIAVILVINRKNIIEAFVLMGRNKVHIWLGLIMLLAAIWGILGLVGKGGFVDSLVQKLGTIESILIVCGLMLLAILLLFGGLLFRSTRKPKVRETPTQIGQPKPDFTPSYGYNKPPQSTVTYQKSKPIAVTSKPKEGTKEYKQELRGERPSALPSRYSLEHRHEEAVKNSMTAPSTFVAPEAKFKNKNIPDVQYDSTVAVKPEKLADKKPAKESSKRDVSFGSGKAGKPPKQTPKDISDRIGNQKLVEQDGWQLPPLDILDLAPPQEEDRDRALQQADAITEALASYGVEAKVVQINTGPAITQFGVEPGWIRKFREVRERDDDGSLVIRREEVSKTRVKVERIKSLQDDLAMALAVRNIRIEAPIPGKSLVGVELPNKTITAVYLRDTMETDSFERVLIKSQLALALGKGVGGESVSADLAKMPHLLIAGATGSGKSVCLNSIICCLIVNNTPADIRFIMIDPKRVEMTPFATLPHLATPIIVEPQKAVGALRWLVLEMENRYELMAKQNARNAEIYNKKVDSQDRLPSIVLVIDELADLMMTSSDEVETILCRLAQKARATGIHLVVATQRPSVDVITGLIKANFPTRISFAVTSAVDSRTILDCIGAEKLLGHGDMFYLPQDSPNPKRLQGCYVSDSEMERLVYFWSRQKTADLRMLLRDEELEEPVKGNEKGAAGSTKSEDPLMESVRTLAEEHGGNISTSLLQRRLSIGYPRAARLADLYRQEQKNSREDDLFDEDKDD